MPHGFDFANAKSLRMDSKLGGFCWMKKIRFDSFVSLNRGFDLTDDKIIEGEYPVIASTSIKAYHNQFKVKAPIVVTGRSGSLGKVQYIDRDGWPLNTSLYAKDYHGNFPKYVYYFLQTIHLEQFNAGAGVPTLNQNHLHSLKLLVHEREQQELVANILSRYDEAIENNNKRIKLLEQMAQNLYKEWFVRFRFPGWENCEFENGIPKGWKVEKLFDVVNVTYGYAFASELFCEDKTLNPVVRIRDILDNRTNTYTSEVCADKYIIKEHEILVGMDGIFHMCMWNGNKAYQNQRVVKLTSKTDEVSNYFLFLSVQPQVKFWEQTIAGTTVAHLGDKHLKRMTVLLPSENLLKKSTKIFNSLMKQKNQLFIANENLAKQRDLLLPRLMSGKLEVN